MSPVLGDLRNRLDQVMIWIRQEPPAEESPWLRRLREVLLVLTIFAREFNRDRIPLRASALTFTIILSLVPTLALGTAVLKGLGAGDQMRQAAHRFIDQMEGATTIWGDTGGPAMVDPDADQEEQPVEQTSAAHLRQAVDQIFDYVDRTDFATLGAFGVIGLVAAVVIVLSSIERAMNAIWQTVVDRPVGRRMMDYLALMILLPLAVNLTLATEATLQSETLQDRLPFFLTISALENLLVSMIPLLLLTLTFTLLYRFLPATRVKFTPALIGGLFGAVAWILVQGLYLKLQIGVARYNAIYGSFATLPLFLVWLQLCWIIFLAGAEMSYATQVRHNYRWDDDELSPVNQLTLAFTLLMKTHDNFQNRQISDPARLAVELHQPESVINRAAATLTDHGLLRPYNDPEDDIHGYMPGTPLEKVHPNEVLDIILGTDIPSQEGASLTRDAMAAAHQALNDHTLVERQARQLADNTSFAKT